MLPEGHSLHLIHFQAVATQQWDPQEIKFIDSVFGYHMEKNIYTCHLSLGDGGFLAVGIY